LLSAFIHIKLIDFKNELAKPAIRIDAGYAAMVATFTALVSSIEQALMPLLVLQEKL
jgi:hypothetical protein